MKKRQCLFNLLAMILLISILVSGGSSSAVLAADDVIKWKCQTFYPTSSPSWKGSVLKVVKEIEERTNGRLVIEPFPASALLQAKEILNGVKRGMIPMGVTAAAYTTAYVPALGIASGLPYSFQSLSQAAYFFKLYGYENMVREIMLDKHGIHMFIDRIYPHELVTKKPVKTYDDFKGLKVRSSGVLLKFFASIGTAATYIGGPELYTSLSTGLVEGAHWGAAMGANKMNLYDMCKYHLKPALAISGTDFWAINDKAFKKLPEDIQTTVEQVLELHFWKRTSEYEFGEITTLAKVQKEKGVVVSELSPADQLKLRQAAIAIWDEEAKSDPSYAEAIKMLKEYLTKLGQL